jgi:hypothetical protein
MTVDGNPTSAVIIAIAVGGEACQRASSQRYAARL